MKEDSIHYLFIWKHKIERDVTSYIVHLKPLIDQINQWIEANIENMRRDIAQYLETDFQQELDKYQKSLNQYLENYRNSLKQGLEDQKKSNESREELEKTLSSIYQEANQLLDNSSPESVTSCLPKVQEFLSKNNPSSC